MKSSTPMISVYMELSVLSFYFVEPPIGNPRPKDKNPTECTLILVWTANGASTHNFKIPLPLSLRVSESLRVLLMYHIRCTNLSQLSLSGARDLVLRNTMDVQVSGIYLLVSYKVFATRLWNSTKFQ